MAAYWLYVDTPPSCWGQAYAAPKIPDSHGIRTLRDGSWCVLQRSNAFLLTVLRTSTDHGNFMSRGNGSVSSANLYRNAAVVSDKVWYVGRDTRNLAGGSVNESANGIRSIIGCNADMFPSILTSITISYLMRSKWHSCGRKCLFKYFILKTPCSDILRSLSNTSAKLVMLRQEAPFLIWAWRSIIGTRISRSRTSVPKSSLSHAAFDFHDERILSKGFRVMATRKTSGLLSIFHRSSLVMVNG